jgi:hypothetical protein
MIWDLLSFIEASIVAFVAANIGRAALIALG